MFEPRQEVIIFWGDKISFGKIIQHVMGEMWQVSYDVNSIMTLPESMMRLATPEYVSQLKQQYETKVILLQNILNYLNTKSQKLLA